MHDDTLFTHHFRPLQGYLIRPVVHTAWIWMTWNVGKLRHTKVSYFLGGGRDRLRRRGFHLRYIEEKTQRTPLSSVSSEDAGRPRSRERLLFHQWDREFIG